MLTTLVLLSAVPDADAACTVSRASPPTSVTVPQASGGATFRVDASADCVRLEFSSGTYSRAMVGRTLHLTPAMWSSLVDRRALTFTWTVTGWDAAGAEAHVTTTNDIDFDHDGWTRAEGDLGTCDRDAARNPDAMDLCDGTDANCDGVETCATLSLSDADAQYDGEAGGDNAGYSVAGVGDVNGDGYADVLVGAHGSDAAATDAGAVYLVRGRATPSSGSLGRPEIVELTGEASTDRAGFAIAGAGDVDGDGLADILVGALRNSDGATNAGAAYLVLGSASPASGSLSLADAEYTGVAAGDAAGVSVAGAGDVNGDGYADLLVGAFYNDDGADLAGAAYLVLGDASPTDRSLSTADAVFTGESYGVQVGNSVAGAGDVDGDGYDDMLVGSAGLGSDGVAYLLLGAASPASASTSSADAEYSGPAADSAGNAIAGAGDVDGDGYDDMLIGAPADSEFDLYAGVTYLVLGSTSPASASLSSADAKYSGDDDQDYSGSSVAGAGDVDSDGYADFLVGTRVDIDGGAAHLILGAPSPASGSLSTANATYTGEASDDVAGAVAGAGDVDGDGYDDVLVGAYGNHEHDPFAGAAYVVLRGGL